ncbi:hypothetical protein PQO03_18640 [Lentisphaera profundi]|uniref:SMODS and SLOG-associating 2TM effector domain-containing protein n=1 Tax=Lentisphaera profundi TaxID=1658616 RepID=A0ABY7VVC1_9BACT|nr:hypothetical protein [Lentisphaera profundi]WDE97846.1 hypothetical protein PQO03_18640 [Lentisphaera profundi]
MTEEEFKKKIELIKLELEKTNRLKDDFYYKAQNDIAIRNAFANERLNLTNQHNSNHDRTASAFSNNNKAKDQMIITISVGYILFAFTTVNNSPYLVVTNDFQFGIFMLIATLVFSLADFTFSNYVLSKLQKKDDEGFINSLNDFNSLQNEFLLYFKSACNQNYNLASEKYDFLINTIDKNWANNKDRVTEDLFPISKGHNFSDQDSNNRKADDKKKLLTIEMTLRNIQLVIGYLTLLFFLVGCGTISLYLIKYI